MEERFSVPYVGAIIERTSNGKKEILLQTRSKPDYDPKYTGTFEIPAGRIRAYENILDALRREVEEETGLKIKNIKGEKTSAFRIRDDENFAFMPFCCAQFTKGPHPYIGFYFVCEADHGTPNPKGEAINPVWVEVNKLRQMIEQERDKFYTLHIAALKLYLEKTIS